eukprot:g3709.t1
MRTRGPARTGTRWPKTIWAAAVVVFWAFSATAQQEGVKVLTVGQCPFCCPEGHAMTFMYEGNSLENLDPVEVKALLANTQMWRCAKARRVRARRASSSHSVWPLRGIKSDPGAVKVNRPPRVLLDKSPDKKATNAEDNAKANPDVDGNEERVQTPGKTGNEEPGDKDGGKLTKDSEKTEHSESKGVDGDAIDPQELKKLHSLLTPFPFKPSPDDKCFRKFGSDLRGCLAHIKTGTCRWIPDPMKRVHGWCVRAGVHIPPPAKESYMKFCREAGIDCNERAGGRCYVKPATGYYPPTPACIFPLGRGYRGGRIVTLFDCRDMKKCASKEKSRKPQGAAPTPKGYCLDSLAEKKLKQKIQSLKEEVNGATKLRPPVAPTLPKPHTQPLVPIVKRSCAKSAKDMLAARPKAAPASCASTMCSFEKSVFGLQANSTSLFCASVLAGKLSHRDMERFCESANAQNLQQEDGWGPGTSALACSQCTEYCKKESVTNVSRLFEATCDLESSFSSELCPNGTMYAAGRCFWLDRGFRTKRQSRGVCRRAARIMYGVEDARVVSGGGGGVLQHAQARTAILSSERLQCVSVGLFRKIRGSAQTLGKAPWCGKKSKMKLRKRDTNETTTNLIPYSYAVARGWIGMQVVPGEHGGPKWDDDTPFEWNNFLSNSAFGNSTRVISSGEDSKPLDVFAAADVESGVWYSVKEEGNPEDEFSFRAYTICEFDAAAEWHEKNASLNIPLEKKKCQNHKLLKVTLELHPNTSLDVATNITEALTSVLAGAFGVPSHMVVHVPHCDNIDTYKSVLEQLKNTDPRHARRRGLSSTGTSLNVAYTIPPSVTQESVDATDLITVSQATTEQVFILSHDDEVVNTPPSVNSMTVQPADPEVTDEKSDEGASDESSYLLLIIGILGGVIGLSLIGIVMMLNFRKRKRGPAPDATKAERHDNSASDRTGSNVSDNSDPELTTDQTNSPRYSSESDDSDAKDAAGLQSRSGTPDTPMSNLTQKGTNEIKPELFHDDGSAETQKSKQAKRGRFLPTAAGGASAVNDNAQGSSVSASLSGKFFSGSLNKRVPKKPVVELQMAEISEHDVLLMDVDESSWKTRGSVGSWEGGSALMEPSILGLFEEQVLDSTIEGSGSQASASAYLNDNFDANDHGMDDDLDLMFEQIMPDASSISSSVPMLPVQADTSADFGSEDLPPGWQAAVDPKTGMTYYANINTGESSWDKPAWDDLVPPILPASKGSETNNVQKEQPGVSIPEPRRRTSSADRRDREQALASRRKGRKWSPEEDAYILKCVKENGASKWKKMGIPINRTGAQCSQRWRKVLDPNVKRFVKWTPAEDAKLIQIHEEHPNWTNKQVAELMPNRTPTQCHNRWNDKVNPALRWGDWSPVEDKIVWEKRQLGHSWSKIVKENPELRDRAHVAVKNRWHSLELARKRKKNKNKKKKSMKK